MEYTILKLAKLSGVSTRTLRYYDEINLLKPSRISESGYRIYGENEVNLLQMILFYRELGMNLHTIASIVYAPDFSRKEALKEHRKNLLEKQNQIAKLLETVEKTIASEERSINMSNNEKFEGFKENLIRENEERYGKEARAKYGDEAVNRSNEKLKAVTQAEYDRMNKLAEEILVTLKEAYKSGDAATPLAQKAADLHRQWLSFYWDHYSSEAHANIAKMYVEDERFKAYYDKEQDGLAEFLRDAVLIYTEKK